MKINQSLFVIALGGLSLAGCASGNPHYGPDGYGYSRYSDRSDCCGAYGYGQGGYAYGYGAGYPGRPVPAPWQQNTALRPDHVENGYGYGYGYAAPAPAAYTAGYSSYSASSGYAYGGSNAYGSGYGASYGGGYWTPAPSGDRCCPEHRICDRHYGH